MISYTEIKPDKRDELIKLIEKQGHLLTDYEGDVDSMIEDALSDVRYEGQAVPYRAATGPSLDHAGGDPPEGGYAEDVEVLFGDEYITEFLTDGCLTSIGETICEEAAENYQDAKQADAEYKADQERDPWE